MAGHPLAHPARERASIICEIGVIHGENPRDPRPRMRDSGCERLVDGCLF
jgi:hypothetical protein